jgi:hypothetical protein
VVAMVMVRAVARAMGGGIRGCGVSGEGCGESGGEGGGEGSGGRGHGVVVALAVVVVRAVARAVTVGRVGRYELTCMNLHV